MPIAPVPFTVLIPIPADPRFVAAFNLLQATMKITAPTGILQGAIVASLPITNVGPVLNTTDNQWYVWNGTQYVPQAGANEVGTTKIFSVNNIDPNHYVQCNGNAYPRIAPYNLLYNVIGTTFGAGDGSTTFNVPNLPQILRCIGSGQVTLASGAGTINNSLITANSTILLTTIAAKSGTPAFTYIVAAAGVATITGGGSDNSTYNYIILDGQSTGLAYAIKYQ